MNDRGAGSTPFNWLLYFVAGGLAGASAALLLAPQSGTATRAMMRRRWSDTTGSSANLKDRLIRRGQKLRAEARRRVGGATSALAGERTPKLPG